MRSTFVDDNVIDVNGESRGLDGAGARDRRVAGGHGRDDHSGHVLDRGLLDAWQLEDEVLTLLLALRLLGFGVVAMIAYVVAGPDGTKQNVARCGIAATART